LKFNLFKYTKDSEEKTVALAGAKFALYADEACTQRVYVVANKDGYTYTKTTGENNVDIVSVDATVNKGNVVVNGLDDGTYYLKETKAPVGYNLQPKVISVTLYQTENNSTTTSLYQTNADKSTAGVTLVEVLNQTGSVLPSTGGIGTTIFYLVGGVLIVAAGAYFILKRKSSSMN
ncbi:MAG: SpaH/EbpB family LPXTG-anchored major pilin, partial [Butyrivibrio sp.]|nr:SpaH/EbpB family LPXTG-anchored major pilin [Butyrivibrio sp.]